ncbi:hypothetical protein Ahu01nite_079100 [Winogradskya humida]|uniref:Transcription regulator PadR N-terminal domain-containing protein n=1 Tax=Winogradskya humida TaxID=113566 RepID=A0ABQ4A1T4_9ACTN|nr:hypothetical protein Ahu01nite_079100 [Actinoplanes humidus]
MLADQDLELHGYAIVKETRRTGPTVYKILERLSAMGWLEARWEDRADEPNRPRRRFYRLTTDGRVEAAALLAQRRPVRPSASPRPALGHGQ